jgi:hypothetical protein
VAGAPRMNRTSSLSPRLHGVPSRTISPDSPGDCHFRPWSSWLGKRHNMLRHIQIVTGEGQSATILNPTYEILLILPTSSSNNAKFGNIFHLHSMSLSDSILDMIQGIVCQVGFFTSTHHFVPIFEKSFGRFGLYAWKCCKSLPCCPVRTRCKYLT